MTYPEARWWHPDEHSPRVICRLCPRNCRPAPGQSGFCRVRRNDGGRLVSLTYGRPVSCGVDPIEKKPLFHFLPGSRVLSLGTVGCNLGCRFCQNWQISRCQVDGTRARRVSPEELVSLARSEATPSIAYTYNEPTVFAEYVIDTARLARKAGLRNVMVSNGFISPAARSDLLADIDAVNVDLKGFSEEFYRRQTSAHLAPVLDTLEWITRETAIWLEVTTLLIPGLNDSAGMLTAECAWLAAHLGPDVPLHLSAFHPDHRMQDRPSTPHSTLEEARRIARGQGLRYVYMGNVADPEAQSTCCPECGATVITRTWHTAAVTGLAGADCRRCGAAPAGIWQED